MWLDVVSAALVLVLAAVYVMLLWQFRRDDRALAERIAAAEVEAAAAQAQVEVLERVLAALAPHASQGPAGADGKELRGGHAERRLTADIPDEELDGWPAARAGGAS